MLFFAKVLAEFEERGNVLRERITAEYEERGREEEARIRREFELRGEVWLLLLMKRIDFLFLVLIKL